MTEHTSIRVTKAAKEAAETSKRESETWNEYLQRCTANPPEVREFVPVEDVVGREVPSAQIDYVEIESRCRSAIEEVLTQ